MLGEEILKSSNAVVVYFAVLLVLVFLCVYFLQKSSKKAEHAYLGTGTQDSSTPFTSGATMRNLSQEFSSTNQGTYGIVHNEELKELVGSGSERLVNERGMPDFWEISSELGAYRDEQAAAFRGDMAAEQTAQKAGAAAANAAAATGAPPAAAAAAGNAAAAAVKKEYLGNLSPRDVLTMSREEAAMGMPPLQAIAYM